ncbi:hypothetical protein BC829DRAFT_420825 [Chytridium lagenaria]|nr:hypothetical protein BC829DRAFT_420825 [Chytridium lagenaria]
MTWSASAALAGSAEAVEAGIPDCISLLLTLQDPSTSHPYIDAEMISMTLLPACTLRGFDDLVIQMLTRSDVRQTTLSILASGQNSVTAADDMSPTDLPHMPTSTALTSLPVLASTDPILQLPATERTLIQRGKRARIMKTVLELYVEAFGSLDPLTACLWRAVVKASQHGFVEIVQMLLTALQKTTEEPMMMGRALLLAIDSGHTEIVNTLLSSLQSASFRCEDVYSTFLIAAHAGHLDIVKLILDFIGRDGGREMGMEESAVEMAAENGHWETALVIHEAVEKERQRGAVNKLKSVSAF